MVLGPTAPSPAVIEVLTGSPFGVELIGGTTPLFNPLGWDPGIGLDAAIELLGWTCTRTSAGSDAAAEALLREAAEDRPLLAGPLEIGLLLYQPGSGKAIGSDHYVVVTGTENDVVRLHDPHGHPHATLPAADFIAAWRAVPAAESIGYSAGPFTAWTGFRRVHDIGEVAALHRALPVAARWLAGDMERPVPPDSLGGAAAVERLAEIAEAGLEPWQRDHLAWFAIRVGARRMADAAAYLEFAGLDKAAAIAGEQARVIGSLQHPLVTGDRAGVARVLRELAPTYARLQASLLGG
jgi:hypothetical protein